MCMWRSPKTHVLTFFLVFVFLISLCNLAVSISPDNQVKIHQHKHDSMEKTNLKPLSLIVKRESQYTLKNFRQLDQPTEKVEEDNEAFDSKHFIRCSFQNKVDAKLSSRRKRYALEGSKWPLSDLTYRISKYPRRLKDREAIDNEIAKALKLWSDESNLKFTRRNRGRVHINILFEEGDHGDGQPFDGPGLTFAHAFFPRYGGGVHFDGEEDWTIDQYNGTNLFLVAAHELGHSLGLAHSDVKESLMAPVYRKTYDPSFTLHQDDVEAIQALYGRRKKKPADPVSTNTTDTTTDPPSSASSTTTKVDITSDPDIDNRSQTSSESIPSNKIHLTQVPSLLNLCNDSTFDAITTTADDHTYFFKGDWYWEISQGGVAEDYPRRIQDDWQGLPGNLDAALTWTGGQSFFFKNNKVWKFRNKVMNPGYPKPISTEFKGIPNNIDAAFVWSGNGKTYFFRGNSFWRYEIDGVPPVSSRYPQSIRMWSGLPEGIDAAFQWTNKKTYFFKGKKYFKLDDNRIAVELADPSYPRLTSVWWLNCPGRPPRNQDHTNTSSRSRVE